MKSLEKEVSWPFFFCNLSLAQLTWETKKSLLFGHKSLSLDPLKELWNSKFSKNKIESTKTNQMHDSRSKIRFIKSFMMIDIVIFRFFEVLKNSKYILKYTFFDKSVVGKICSWPFKKNWLGALDLKNK